MTRSKNAIALANAIDTARWTGKTQTLEVGGDKFEVKCFYTDRECYDFEPTPTAVVYLNGKRIARQAAMSILS